MSFNRKPDAELTWDGVARRSTVIKSGVPQGSPLSPVLFLIGVAKALESADTRIGKEIPSHRIKVYSYVDDFNCTTELLPRQRPGRQLEAITAARKARNIVSEELKNHGWTRDPDKDKEINFGIQGEAKWVGIHFTHNLQWKTHCSKRLDQAEAAWACIARLGNSRGGLSPTAWRQVYTGSIRAIATYEWELGHTEPAMERLRKLQYKVVRKVTGAYHGVRQETLKNIAKVEPVQAKVRDMQVRACARILEKGVQDDLITKTTETRSTKGGRDWMDHSAAWITVKKPHYNTCLEEILSSIRENGEREIPWDFDRKARAPQALTKVEELGTKDTDKVVWELRIRKELEEEGWTVCYSDGSGLNDKAAGAYIRKCFLGFHEEKTGSKYLGTRATHNDGELIGIA